MMDWIDLSRFNHVDLSMVEGWKPEVDSEIKRIMCTIDFDSTFGDIYEALGEISKLLDQFEPAGVFVPDEGYPPIYSLEYVNNGESYDVTIGWDYDTGWYIGSWADWFEEKEREYMEEE